MGQLGANVNWTEPTAVQRNESLGSDGIFVIRPKEGPGTYFSAAETHVIRYLFQSSDANVIVCEFPILFDVLGKYISVHITGLFIFSKQHMKLNDFPFFLDSFLGGGGRK